MMLDILKNDKIISIKLSEEIKKGVSINDLLQEVRDLVTKKKTLMFDSQMFLMNEIKKKKNEELVIENVCFLLTAKSEKYSSGLPGLTISDYFHAMRNKFSIIKKIGSNEKTMDIFIEIIKDIDINKIEVPVEMQVEINSCAKIFKNKDVDNLVQPYVVDLIDKESFCETKEITLREISFNINKIYLNFNISIYTFKEFVNLVKEVWKKECENKRDDSFIDIRENGSIMSITGNEIVISELSEIIKKYLENEKRINNKRIFVRKEVMDRVEKLDVLYLSKKINQKIEVGESQKKLKI